MKQDSNQVNWRQGTLHCWLKNPIFFLFLYQHSQRLPNVDNLCFKISRICSHFWTNVGVRTVLQGILMLLTLKQRRSSSFWSVFNHSAITSQNSTNSRTPLAATAGKSNWLLEVEEDSDYFSVYIAVADPKISWNPSTPPPPLRIRHRAGSYVYVLFTVFCCSSSNQKVKYRHSQCYFYSYIFLCFHPPCRAFWLNLQLPVW